MNPAKSSVASPTVSGGTQRLRTAGKYLVRGDSRFFLDGVSYGPFAPNSRGEPLPEDGRLATDLSHIRSLGFNAVRLYELPSHAMLKAADENELLILAGIPWAEHIDFLSSHQLRVAIEQTVGDAAQRLGTNRSVAALLIGNEIEKTLVRWLGPLRVRAFLERLIDIAKGAAPQTLVSYATYPSTEYLVPRNADFLAMNVYLEQRADFERYLLRLQNLAGNKPLVISEFGIDAVMRGEQTQAEVLRWQREALRRAGAAGNVWFSYTDDWQRGGRQIEDWHFGLVDRDRKPRLACDAARACAPKSDAASALRISAIVCTRNGSATLRECLAALGRQTHVDYEVIVVDDGSTDATADIARSFPFVRYAHQPAAGLSAARNRGAAEATGEILAYTDDDCMPDQDWLARLATAYDDPQWVAAGGPNIPPPPRNRIEAIVAAAPGAPTHVLLCDEEAEHLPGCNFSVRKEALLAIGGFRDEFTTAGDDVDICWRLRAAGGRLRFVASAMVWHHRRFTVRAYLRQQSGYGHAEALLMKRHPSRFGPLGGARWRGAIYGDGLGLREPSEGLVYHGPFGFAPFQAIYPEGIAEWWDLFSGVMWIALVVLAVLLKLPIMSAFLFGGSIWAAWLRERRSLAEGSTRGLGERLLLGLLCWLQPIVREWSRLRSMIRIGARPSSRPSLPEIIIPRRSKKRSRRIAALAFWSENGVGRDQWLDAMRQLLGEKKISFRDDDGWHGFDIEMAPGRVITHAFLTVTEYHGDSRQLTRVALLQRYRLRGLLFILIGAVGLWILITRLTPFWGFRSEFIIAFVMIFQAAVMNFFGKVGSTNLIHQAAERVGLIRLDDGAAGN